MHLQYDTLVSKPKRSKLSARVESKTTLTEARVKSQNKLPSIVGYVREVGVQKLLRHISATDPSSILNLPLVVRERNAFGREKISATETTFSEGNRKLRMKSARLQSQLTKSNKKQALASRMAATARTKLSRAKTKHSSQMSALQNKFKTKHQEVSHVFVACVMLCRQ